MCRSFSQLLCCFNYELHITWSDFVNQMQLWLQFDMRFVANGYFLILILHKYLTIVLILLNFFGQPIKWIKFNNNIHRKSISAYWSTPIMRSKIKNIDERKLNFEALETIEICHRHLHYVLFRLVTWNVEALHWFLYSNHMWFALGLRIYNYLLYARVSILILHTFQST